MDVREVDRSDEELLHRLWRLGWEAASAGRPWHTYRDWPSSRHAWMRPSSTSQPHLLAAYDAGQRPVGLAEVCLYTKDNLRLAELEFYVSEPHRRGGIGNALFERAAELARDKGRTLAHAEAYAPVGSSSAGLEFAAALGFKVGQSDVMKLTGMDRIREHAIADVVTAAQAYRLVTWTDRCPEEHLEAFCCIAQRFMSEVPLGELEYEPLVIDGARVREGEERHRATGRFETVTMALTADGSPAGYTEMMSSSDRPEIAWQGATLVLPEHRGHRLGMRLKVANATSYSASRPDCRHVITGNAGENVHMNAINDDLGFRPIERCLEMQRPL